uniref:Uncharacterized protein n=1 Tax=Megaselia scalaris TaxID=36166 RepID=T1GC30_MEGSC
MYNLDKFSCDIPAMSMVKGIKGHCGYYCCPSCTIKGRYYEDSRNIGFVVHEDNIPTPRTNENFRDFYGAKTLQSEMFVDHHLSEQPSPILSIPNLDIIKAFPRDSIHLVFLGVSKKTISFWVDKPTINKSGKLSSHQINKINIILIEVSTGYPNDFNRKPTSISEYNNWKATEHRSFLLYHHYLKHRHLLSLAENYLEVFVNNFAVIYGEGYSSYNVHNLLHLADDCRQFGVLDDFSCFKFENKLGWLVKLLSTGFLPLAQAAKRIMSQFDYELRNYNLKADRNLPSFEKRQHFGFLKVVFDKFYLETDTNNQWFLSTQPHKIISFKFARSDEKLMGRVIPNRWASFTDPIDSRHLFIYYSDGNESEEITSYSIDEVFAKMFRIKYENKIMFVPLLHTFK